MVKRALPKLSVVENAQLDERRFEGKLSCGARLIFAPRKGFTKKLAFVVAAYGSIDRAWVQDGKRVEVPDGIAHFLEHQLFKKQRGDLTDEFSSRGAYTNAHTSHTMTAFYFECVEHFEDNLATLCELAMTPWFERKLVETERDIIIQEINQYRDNPNWVGFQQLLETLYVKHPLRVDIAGTSDTVSRITPRLLELCHKTFYHPDNLTVVITGDMDARDVVRLAEETTARFAYRGARAPVERERPDEPGQPARPGARRAMFLSRPRLLLGFKDRGTSGGRALATRELHVALTMDCLFSRESEFYERAYADGLIAPDFGASYQAEIGFGYAVIGGETRDPGELEMRVRAELERARRHGLDASTLERKKKKFLGRYLRNFNDPESTAYSLLSALGQRSELFDFPALAAAATPAEIHATLREVFDPAHSASSVLMPQGR